MMRRRCMGCKHKMARLQIHEIERRAHAPKTWAHMCNYLLLCPTCHGWPFDYMQHAKQLAHKLFWDSTHYDLDAWLRLRDTELLAPTRVLQSEVDHYLVDVKEKFA